MVWRRTPAGQSTILFQHIAKCGGTSLVEHFGQLGQTGICLGFPCQTKQEVADEARRLLAGKGIKPSRLRAIYGHRVYYGLHQLLTQPCRYVTMLREPVERVVSLYNHHAGIAMTPAHPLHARDRAAMIRDGKLIPFEHWLHELYTGNHMVRFLYYAMEGELVDPPGPMTSQHLEAAKRFIDACWFVGTTETSEEDFAVICSAVGLATPRHRANVSQRYCELAADDPRRAEILELDQLDQALYGYAQAHRARFVAAE